jgi:hypothetical protein
VENVEPEEERKTVGKRKKKTLFDSLYGCENVTSERNWS